MTRFACRVIALLGVVIGLAGCVAGPGDGYPPAARYDGRTLFRGLLLAQGPVAIRLPDIWSAILPGWTAQTAVQTGRADEGVTSRIEKARPEFFEQFAREIQSGDPVRIEMALVEGVRLGKEALTALGIRPAALVCDPDNPFPAPECAGENAAIFFSFAAVAAAVDGGRLMRDQIVVAIAAGLVAP